MDKWIEGDFVWIDVKKVSAISCEDLYDKEQGKYKYLLYVFIDGQKILFDWRYTMDSLYNLIKQIQELQKVLLEG